MLLKNKPTYVKQKLQKVNQKITQVTGPHLYKNSKSSNVDGQSCDCDTRYLVQHPFVEYGFYEVT